MGWNPDGNAADASVARKIADAREKAKEAARIASLPFELFADQREAFEQRLRKDGNPIALQEMLGLLALRRTDLRMQIEWQILRAAIARMDHGDAAFNAIRDPAGNGNRHQARREWVFPDLQRNRR